MSKKTTITTYETGPDGRTREVVQERGCGVVCTGVKTAIVFGLLVLIFGR